MATHKFLSVVRVIKKILKQSIHQDSFYSEINILKRIRHENIPIIYDIEEDDEAFYIIEEYIDGISLLSYVRDRGSLEEEEACLIGIKICEIISFLHNQQPIPILFLDIHPNNIMIKKDKIYLIDFGNSYFINEASHRRLLLGTVGYAAPEQYTYGSLDERTDIYGIGAVLYYMVTGLRCDHTSLKSLEIPNNIRERYKKIILQCLSKDMDERFKSVSAIQDNLENIVKKDSACESGEKPLTIAISGTKTRVGVTHVSLGLAAYMSALGYDVMYQEVNESNHMRNMAKQLGLPLEGGWFVKDGLKIMPEYGESVRLSVHERYIIKDFGVAREDIYGTLAACDIICLIDSADYWDLSQSVKMVQSLRMYLGLVTHPVKFYLLCNTSGKCATELYRQTGYVGMEIPCIRDIFERDRAVEQFYRELIVAFGIEKRAGENHKKKRRLFCKT